MTDVDKKISLIIRSGTSFVVPRKRPPVLRGITRYISFAASASLIAIMLARGVPVYGHPTETHRYVIPQSRISSQQFFELLEHPDFLFLGSVSVITTGTSFTTASTFASLISMEAIAAGGTGGIGNASNTTGGGGGGAGAYGKIVSATIAANTAYTIQIGVEGGTTTVGNSSSAGGTANTGFKDGSGNWVLLAAGGAAGAHGGTSNAGGAGGTAANSIGSTKNSGGSGGAAAATAYSGGGGGGGAAGPNGNGATGSSSTSHGRRKWRCR